MGFLLSASSISKRALWLFSLGLLFLALFSTGCARLPAGNSNRKETREVVDESGRRLVVPTRVSRVVTLAPNLTEIVFAIGAGDRVVGNTTYCDYPEPAKHVAKVGDTLQPSVERIIALHPEVILVSTASQLEAFTAQLEAQSIAVYVTDPHDLEGVLRSIMAIGELLGESDHAAQLVANLRQRTVAVEERVRPTKPLQVFFQLSPEPLYTAGRDAFVTDLIKRAGGESVTHDVPGAWPRYSAESAVAARPEAIIMASAESMGGTANDGIAAPLNKSPAALAGRVYKVNGDFLTRPGPRLIDGLEQIARALHPDVFK
jgi:iron complex transport system substrate-binding protein